MTSEHTCTPPELDPQKPSTFAQRRWVCTHCRKRWRYVRYISTVNTGEWVADRTSTDDTQSFDTPDH